MKRDVNAKREKEMERFVMEKPAIVKDGLVADDFEELGGLEDGDDEEVGDPV